ncbi:MAG: hypothetical protein ACYC0V_17940 [Armatimonadota bacterium]
MKKSLPGWLAAVIVVVMLLIIWLVYNKMDMGGSAKAQERENLIKAGVAGGAPKTDMPSTTALPSNNPN